jgi:hypothetical protein
MSHHEGPGFKSQTKGISGVCIPAEGGLLGQVS